MFDNAKNMSKDLAKSKTLSTFVLPNAYYFVVSIYTYLQFRYKAGLSCGTSLTSSGRLATKTREARLFFVPFFKTFRPCQTPLKVVPWYKVPELHLSKILPNDSLSSCCKATSSDPLRRTACIVALYRSLPSGVTTSSGAVTPQWSTCQTSWKPSGPFTVIDSLCRSWKQSVKAACRGTIVPALHRIGFSLYRTKKSPYVSNSSRWTSLNVSLRPYVSFSLA